MPYADRERRRRFERERSRRRAAERIARGRCPRCGKNEPEPGRAVCAKLTAPQRRELLDILEDRHRHRSTVVTSQLPVEHWHKMIGEIKTVTHRSPAHRAKNIASAA